MSGSAEYVLVYLAILVPAVSILVLALALRLRARAPVSGVPTRFASLMLFALVALVVGVIAGATAGYAIMFGPSHVTGDFIALPWFTMLPAVGIGLWVFFKVNQVVAPLLLNRAARKHSAA